MKNFKVVLTRSYAVNIAADNIESAKELTEYFIGNPKDVSNEKDRENHHFKIEEIEMVLNEAYDAEELEV